MRSLLRKWIVGLLLLGVAPSAWAVPSRTFTYTTGQTIDPSQVTTNEDNIFSYLQAGVDTYVAKSLNTASIADNAITGAQILNGTITPADLSGTPVDDAIYVADSASAATWRTLPNCADTTGNHLNYTQATNTFSCGTTHSSVSAFVGTFTRDTTVASGTQAITGVGFQPSAVIFLAAQDSSREASWGVDDGTRSAAILDRQAVSGTYLVQATAFSIFDDEVSGTPDDYRGVITTLGTDGFTVTWTKRGTPSGTLSVQYLALR